jgi:hypothetical protein
MSQRLNFCRQRSKRNFWKTLELLQISNLLSLSSSSWWKWDIVCWKKINSKKREKEKIMWNWNFSLAFQHTKCLWIERKLTTNFLRLLSHTNASCFILTTHTLDFLRFSTFRNMNKSIKSLISLIIIQHSSHLYINLEKVS